MSFRCDRDESRFLIEAEGSLGIEVAAEFKATLVEAASSGLATHLDIARATSIDASCLQLIWAAANRTSPAIQPLSVVGDLPASIELAIHTAGFDDLLGPVTRKAPHDEITVMPGARADA